MRTYKRKQPPSLNHLVLFSEAIKSKRRAKWGAEVEPGGGFWNETFISLSCAGILKGIQ